MLVKSIEQIYGILSFISVIANTLPDNRPVLLFDVTRVIAVIGSASCKTQIIIFAVIEEMIIDELGAVVRTILNSG